MIKKMLTVSSVSLAISPIPSKNHQIHNQNFHFRLNPSQPIKFHLLGRTNFGAFHQKDRSGLWVCRGRWVLLGLREGKAGILMGHGRFTRKKRVVLAKFNERVGFDGGDGGGGGRRGDGTTARVLGNIALAVGLTYLSMTGKLGWILDTIVSLWLLAVIVPIVGLGALLWWAGRDMIEGTCPNCGNDFQILKFTLNEELQLCPFCTQPFSVVGDEFVSDPVKFSNSSTPFEQAFNGFSPRSKQGKDTQTGVVDIEAEIKDAD
ncbi:hypothetical protein Dimus_019018 [Dionaea muscipula]